MFYYDNGLKLTGIDLAIDIRRRQPLGFISHAHADHMAPHELTFCTPETARLFQHRYGERRVSHLPYGTPRIWGSHCLTTYPAGHVLGSAMLLADDGDRRLLYTGDFKLGPSYTAARAQLPQADILIMECTFGQPRYRFPGHEESIEQLVEIVHASLRRNVTPVIHAYVLGKSQEVTRILTERGIGVLQHPLIYEVSRVYEQCGCSLGDCSVYRGQALAGHVVIAPPINQRATYVPLPEQRISIAVTGWAVDPRTRNRLGVDVALAMSDHADYDELFECVERVQPQVVYCTHGPESFVESLRQVGHNAHWLPGKQAPAR